MGGIDVTCSTHALKRYKPNPDVYAYASKMIGVKPEAIAFHSSNVWDAAGAASFGWHAFWINRTHLVPEYTWAGLRECPGLCAALAHVHAMHPDRWNYDVSLAPAMPSALRLQRPSQATPKESGTTST